MLSKYKFLIGWNWFELIFCASLVDDLILIEHFPPAKVIKIGPKKP